MPAPAIDMSRFLDTLAASSAIGQGREGGLSRLALSEPDKEVRDMFAGLVKAQGMSLSIDGVGSMFARREGLRPDLPPVLIGSHLDTQANGGRFDGILGVLGGLEVVRALDAAGITPLRSIEVVNWTNEEGARFSPPMVASGAFAGVYTPQWTLARPSDDGPTLGEALDQIGYRGTAPVGGRPIDAYFELHIEQGPVLDAVNMQVGVVTHGYTSHGFLVAFTGETAHTGPWPMERRKNALVAGARLLVASDDIGWDFAESGGKGTAARLVAWPNKPGILSDWAEVVCDVRHDSPASAAVMAERVRRAIGESAARAGCEARILDSWTWGGHIFDRGLVEAVRASAVRQGFRHIDIASQAGHDAYFMARVAPTAMIFTPCRGGITHNNRELCLPEDMAPGLDVLLDVVLQRANRQA
jgi:beta-ureidopropionase / N-carbamoyl-L-amino-acid hydrolase